MSRGRAETLRLACLVLAASLVHLFASVWLLGRPFVMGALFAGGVAALLSRSSRAALWTGGAAGLLGGAATLAYVDAPATTARVSHLPAVAIADAPVSFFGVYVTGIMQYHPVNLYFADPLSRLAYVLIAAVATAAVGGLLALARRSRLLRGRRAAALLVVLLAAAFATTAWSQTDTLRGRIDERPKAGTYEYDAHIYLATYYEMGRGLDYYHALIAGASGDKRVIAEKGVVDGLFRKWGTPPLVVREPWAFRLWRLIPGGAVGVLGFAIAAEAALLAALWWAFEPYLGDRAVLVPALLVPLSLARVATIAVFMPDHWAAIALLACLVALLRERFAAAVAFALAAALFRETAALWLVTLAGVAVVLWLRRREGWGRRAAVALAAVAVFAVAFAVHYRAASAIGIPPADANAAPAIVVQARVRPLAQRFVAPASYLMYAYGFYVLPAWTFLVLQLPGLALVLRRRRDALVPALAFAVLWPAFTLTAGANSSYWGELYVPFAVAASAALLALGLPRPESPAQTSPSGTMVTEATEGA